MPKTLRIYVIMVVPLHEWALGWTFQLTLSIKSRVEHPWVDARRRNILYKYRRDIMNNNI